ncbi:MAG: hypothetical protein APF76_06825 [Desulfitibacter sp. BRH_c19]|nr:MAG: hypothetical protein APF76_06825 [Desulfitibacter sp. BRH_c19]
MPPYYELLCLKLNKNAPDPKFKECVIKLEVSQKQGVSVHYSHQCPFCENYIGMLKEAAKEENIPLFIRKYETLEEAQQAPSVSTTFSLFLNGKFIAHEILTKDKFKILLL